MLRIRSGTTLIELLIFITVIGVIASFALPILFSATENRILQQTIFAVEQNGTQAMQTIALRIRDSEEILDPPVGETGSVLTLKTGSGDLDPVIIGVNSGSIVLIDHTTRRTVTSPQVAVQNFVVRNTSNTDDSKSVYVTFSMSRTIRLQQPHSYNRDFEMTVALFPDDQNGDDCGCVPPYCQGNNVYAWQVCESSNCFSADTPLECR